jgi:hypothetical protein
MAHFRHSYQYNTCKGTAYIGTELQTCLSPMGIKARVAGSFVYVKYPSFYPQFKVLNFWMSDRSQPGVGHAHM